MPWPRRRDVWTEIAPKYFTDRYGVRVGWFIMYGFKYEFARALEKLVGYSFSETYRFARRLPKNDPIYPIAVSEPLTLFLVEGNRIVDKWKYEELVGR